MATVVVALVLIAPSATSAISQYWNGVWCCGNMYHSGYNYWADNVVWRPVGYTTRSFYHNSSGNVHPVINTWNNPFHNYGPWGYSQGWCDNYDNNSYQATCQVNT
jgi:hypothetical protein